MVRACLFENLTLSTVGLIAGIGRSWSLVSRELICGERQLAAGWGDNVSVARVYEAIQRLLADGFVSDAEVTGELEPALAAENAGAAEVRLLYDAMVGGRFGFDGRAATRVTLALQDRGYLMPPPTARQTYPSTTPSGGFGRQASPAPPSAALSPSAATPEVLPQSTLTTPDQAFARLALATGRTAGNITVAVADVPVDFRHPAIANSPWVNPHEVPGNGFDEDDGGQFPDDVNGFDFVRRSGHLADSTQWHGNASAALAVQGTTRIRAMATTVMYASNFDPLFNAIDYAVRKGARVINLSTTMATPQSADRLFRLLQEYPDTLFVLAAGNESRHFDNATAVRMGADMKALNLIVVGAANEDGSVWRSATGGSNTGSPWVTVAARGSNVRVPLSYDEALAGLYYGLSEGTSVATPQVANIAAKCLLLSPRLNAADIHNIIVETADRRAEWTGLALAEGTMNAERAMTTAAVIGLMVDGYSLDAALDRVQSAGVERARISTSVARLLRK